MRIGVDIDGVITDLDEFRKSRGEIFFQRKCKNDRGNDIDEMFEVTKEEMADFWDNNLYLYHTEAPLKEGVSETLKKLKIDGYKIIVITARKPNPKFDFYDEKKYQETTKTFLDKMDIYYDEIIFTPFPKTSAIKEAKIDIMIEDSPVVAESIKDFTRVVLLKTNYNADVILDGVSNKENWNEIYDMIKDLQ